MLTPDDLDTLPDALVALWQQVEEDILRDVARRIGKLGEVTETAAWQLWRFEQVQALRQDVVSTLAGYTGRSNAEIRRLLEQAASDALAADDAIYRSAGKDPAPVNDSPALLNLLNAGYLQTAGEWQNLTATTANTVTRQFEAALDRAWLQVSSGAFDYKTAVRKAVGGLAERMDGVTYPSGHTDTLEVAVRRAVLTGVNQTAGKLQTARMDEMDCEFVETTAHAGARPEHAVWQGKVFHRGGAVTYRGKRYEDFETSTGYGTGPGLCGWNCRHNFWPFYPGLSEPNYSAAELAALNEKCIGYNGQKYTKYEISQMQRAAERNVRRWKKRYLAEDAAGLDTTESALRLKAARQSLAQFVRDTGGRNDSARTGVAGFGRSEASRAAWAVKKNSSVYSSLNTEPKPVTMQSIGNVRAFRCETLDATGQQQLKNAHKRLLMTASRQPTGVEVGRIFDLNMKPLSQDIIGSSNGHSVRLPDSDVPYVAIHTHPACGNFSNGDLDNFTKNQNLKLLTAIGHDGHVYAVEKSADYDSNVADSIVWQLNSEIKRLENVPRAELPDAEFLERADMLIQKAIHELEKNGVKFYE